MKLLFLVCTVMVFAACKKEDVQRTDRELLMHSEWVVAHAIVKPGADPNAEVPSADVACDSVGTMKLLEEGTITSTSPNGNCIIGTDFDEFAWEYTEEDKWLKFSRTGGSVQTFGYNLLDISTTQLTLYSTQVEIHTGETSTVIYYLQAL